MICKQFYLIELVSVLLINVRSGEKEQATLGDEDSRIGFEKRKDYFLSEMKNNVFSNAKDHFVKSQDAVMRLLQYKYLELLIYPGYSYDILVYNILFYRLNILFFEVLDEIPSAKHIYDSIKRSLILKSEEIGNCKKHFLIHYAKIFQDHYFSKINEVQKIEDHMMFGKDLISVCFKVVNHFNEFYDGKTKLFQDLKSFVWETIKPVFIHVKKVSCNEFSQDFDQKYNDIIWRFKKLIEYFPISDIEKDDLLNKFKETIDKMLKDLTELDSATNSADFFKPKLDEFHDIMDSIFLKIFHSDFKPKADKICLLLNHIQSCQSLYRILF